MSSIDDLVRNSRHIQDYIADAKDGRTTHAYAVICEDEQSVTIALRIMAQALFCQYSACAECIACKRIADGNNSNVHYYDVYNKDIISSIISATYIQPFEEGSNVFILDKFDTITAAMQNKLLKTVEEPQEGVIMLLGFTNESAVLPTVASRVKKIYLHIWNDVTIREVLRGGGHDTDSIDFAVRFASGSVTRAKSLVQDKSAIANYNRMNELLTVLENSSQIPMYIKYFGAKSEELVASLGMLELIFASELRSAVKGAETPINKRYNAAAISNIIDCIIDARAQTKVNVSAANIVTNLLLSILEMRYRTA